MKEPDSLENKSQTPIGQKGKKESFPKFTGQSEDVTDETQDDEIISKVFFKSLLVIVGLALLGGALWLVLRPKPEKQVEQVTKLTGPTEKQQSTVRPPKTPFLDVTQDAGLDFKHDNGATGEKLLPESLGGGVAFLDLTGDGAPDLLFVDGDPWPWDQQEPKDSPAGDEPKSNGWGGVAFFKNNGDGTFVDQTQEAGLDVSFYGMGVSAGDMDRDGDLDLYITAVGANHLFLNDGSGRFSEVAEAGGAAGGAGDWSTSSVWIDFDRDGWLDLFVCNYVKWSREIDIEVGFQLTGVGRAYGPPMDFAGAFPSLFRNRGDGTFEDVSEQAGVQVKNSVTGAPMAKSLGVAPTDLNSDGWVDLIVANDTVQNFVFLNNQDGTFKESGALTGIAFDSYGKTRGAMGIDTANFRNDEVLGVGIGNFANEMTALYVSTPNSTLLFTDEAIAQGIGPDSRLPLKFGLFFFDYDLDGWLDLMTVNGHLEEEISVVQKSQTYKQSPQLFWNLGASDQDGFTLVTAEETGADFQTPIVGRGSAFADMDGDGDLDFVFTQIGGSPHLFRNEQNAKAHWIRLTLQDKQGSSSGSYGAKVQLKADSGIQSRYLTTTRSYLSQSEPVMTFGLGASSKIQELKILWPDGSEQIVEGAEDWAPGQSYIVTQEEI